MCGRGNRARTERQVGAREPRPYEHPQGLCLSPLERKSEVLYSQSFKKHDTRMGEWNAADAQYAPNSEENRRKLYVVSTRAMHQLIFHKYPNTSSTLVDALVGSGLVLRA